MNLQKEFHSCFGCADKILAGHQSDEKRLKELMKDCRSNGISYEDFEKEVVYYLWKLKIHESLRINHIDQQIKLLESYWK